MIDRTSRAYSFTDVDDLPTSPSQRQRRPHDVFRPVATSVLSYRGEPVGLANRRAAQRRALAPVLIPALWFTGACFVCAAYMLAAAIF